MQIARIADSNDGIKIALHKHAKKGRPCPNYRIICSKELDMTIFASSILLAAAGYSLLYLLLGGGLGGAVVIFIIAKMLGK